MSASTTRNVIICYEWCLNSFAVLKGCCPDITVRFACLHSKFFIYRQRQFSNTTLL
jgi:hypothetical protein